MAPFLTTLIALLAGLIPAQAQPTAPTREASEPVVVFWFGFDDATLRPDYSDNRRSLAQLDSLIRSREFTILDTLRIVGKSSIDGPYTYNALLAMRRARSVRTYITRHYPDFQGTIDVQSEGEVWSEFREAVAGDASLSDVTRARMLEIIDSDASPDRKEARLKSLPSWRMYYRALFPTFRSATVTPSYWTLDMPRIDDDMMLESLSWIPPVQAITLRPDNLIVPALTGPSSRAGAGKLARAGRSARAARTYYPARKTVVALKTNLAYDALTMVNYAIEVPVGDRFSAVWEHYFPWWVMRNNRTCIEYLTLGGEFRWWFVPQPRPETDFRMQRDRLIGHYLGLYGLWGKTDLQWDMLGRYQCYPVVSCGLTYGYSFPVSRHLNLELSASIGYARIPYQHYIPSEDWQILWRDNSDAGITHYFGPTKIQVTLVRPILATCRVREGANR